MWFISLLFKNLFVFPLFLYYQIYDRCIYAWYNHKKLFKGWGIHLFTGKFGQGKTSVGEYTFSQVSSDKVKPLS